MRRFRAMADEQDVTRQSESAPIQRYSAPGHKYPLVCADQERLARANAQLRRSDLSEYAQAAGYFHEITGVDGLEFVAFSNLRLPNGVQLPRDLYLLPCFADLDGDKSADHAVTEATQRMTVAGRFIYDGWLPIRSWDDESLNTRILDLDEILSSFALTGSIWFDWEPKYRAVLHSSAAILAGSQLRDWATAVQAINGLPDTDRAAIFRSVGWLAQAIRLNEPSARLLFSVVAMESLATYIEEDAADDSPLAVARSATQPRARRRAERDSCVQAIMAASLASEPWKAVSQAYFQCAGTQNMLRAHLNGLFPSASAADIDQLLKGETETPGLYKVRSAIAHGHAESISRLEMERMRGAVHDAEQFARDYITAVLVRAVGIQPFNLNLLFEASSSFLDSVYSADGMYQGPTDLATLYGAAGGYSPGGSVTLPRSTLMAPNE